MDVDRLDLEIYLIKCPHRRFLSYEDEEWCRECDEWIEGVEVGDITAAALPGGTVTVYGGGYISQEEP